MLKFEGYKNFENKGITIGLRRQQQWKLLAKSFLVIEIQFNFVVCWSLVSVMKLLMKTCASFVQLPYSCFGLVFQAKFQSKVLLNKLLLNHFENLSSNGKKM